MSTWVPIIVALIDMEQVDVVLAITSAMVKRIKSFHSLPLLPVEPDDY